MSTNITHAAQDSNSKMESKVQLEELFRHSRPYLQPGYSLRLLSGELGLPLHQVSALINREYDMRFTDFVNLHRIHHGILLIRQGNAWQWSLAGLAAQCGFRNRNSFRDAFKRFTGFTPSDYIKQKITATLPWYKKTG